MERSEVDPRVKNLVFKTYGDNNINYWEALNYISEKSYNKLIELSKRNNDSVYSVYLDVINGIRTEEFLSICGKEPESYIKDQEWPENVSRLTNLM